MNAEIVTTGTEILLGEIVDTNAAYIARQLREIGVNVFYKTTVGDNQARLVEVLRLGLTRSDVILITGGLGPTVDDITREAVAEATDRPLQQDAAIAEQLSALFAGWGRTLTPNNLRQSYLPAGALALANPVGTAPGILVEVEHDGALRAIICMPGVPREMKRMMSDHVLPYLQMRMGGEHGVIRARVLHAAGLGESVIDDRIGHLMHGGNPTVGLAAHPGRVDVRITARADSLSAAEALIAPMEAEIRQILGVWIYGADEETLGGVVARLLRERGWTLALFETNTGGRIAQAIDEADPTRLKTTDLAEPFDLSEEDARACAERLRATAQADIAMAVLGSADPTHGFWSPSRGDTYMALSGPGVEWTRHVGVGGADEFTSTWLAIDCLNALRRRLMEDGRPVDK